MSGNETRKGPGYPENGFEGMANTIDGMRIDFLFDDETDVGHGEGEQLYLIALAHLEISERYMRMAHMAHMKRIDDDLSKL